MPSKSTKKPAKKEKPAGRGTSKASAPKKPAAKAGGKAATKKPEAASKKLAAKAKASVAAAKTNEKLNGKARDSVASKPAAPAKVSAPVASKPALAKEPVVVSVSTGSSSARPTPKKPKVKSKIQMPVDPLFKPGAKWKPLIPSGPNATPTGLVGHHTNAHGTGKPQYKTTLNKRELDGYRKILMQKRAELVGDIRHMEDEALRQSGSGSLSQTPQHMADQGSDTFEQSLSLDLAAVDRSLIREIDDALKRIDDGTYGMCERTGKAINAMRLNELPWARYSIEAAREIERRPYQE